MYTVTSTFTANAKPSIVRIFEGLNKGQVIDHLEAALISTMCQLNKFASDNYHKNIKHPRTRPVATRYSFVIQENGQMVSSRIFYWTRMSDEAQVLMLSYLNNSFNAMPADIKQLELGRRP